MKVNITSLYQLCKTRGHLGHGSTARPVPAEVAEQFITDEFSSNMDGLAMADMLGSISGDLDPRPGSVWINDHGMDVRAKFEGTAENGYMESVGRIDDNSVANYQQAAGDTARWLALSGDQEGNVSHGLLFTRDGSGASVEVLGDRQALAQDRVFEKANQYLFADSQRSEVDVDAMLLDIERELEFKKY